MTAHFQLDGIRRMTPEEHKEFVSEWCAGRIFSHRHIPEHFLNRIENVFLPIAFGAFQHWSKADLSNVLREGLLYENTEKAMPVMIGNMPSFFSVTVMHPDDWVICREGIEKMEATLASLGTEEQQDEPAQTPEGGKDR